jgi:hypothetical protein
MVSSSSAKVLSVMVLLTFSSGISAQDAAKAKGTAIGTVIASAIDTALPGISKLTSSIVEIFKPRDNVKAEKQKEVETAVTSATNALSQAIKEEVKKVEPLATQLDTLGPFLQYGFRANAEISGLMAVLAPIQGAASPEWANSVAPRWAKIKGALGGIVLDANDIKKNIVSEQMQQLLLGVMEAKTVTVPAIEADLAAKNKAGLMDELTKLGESLATLHVVARIQINGISNEVHSLVNWAQGAGKAEGGPQQLPAAIQTDFGAATNLLKQAASPRVKN